jgi:hypothetical protein
LAAATKTCVGPVLRHPAVDVALAAQVHLTPADGENLAAFVREAANKRGAHHASVAGDPDLFTLEFVER